MFNISTKVFEKRMLRRIFGPKRDKVMGVWSKLHNEEPCDLYFLPGIIRIIKSMMMVWVENVAQMGRKGRNGPPVCPDSHTTSLRQS
jgi:hypothetical protein